MGDHNRENMGVVGTRYHCASGKHGKSCSAHVGSVCNTKKKWQRNAVLDDMQKHRPLEATVSQRQWQRKRV